MSFYVVYSLNMKITQQKRKLLKNKCCLNKLNKNEVNLWQLSQFIKSIRQKWDVKGIET